MIDVLKYLAALTPWLNERWHRKVGSRNADVLCWFKRCGRNRSGAGVSTEEQYG